MPFISIRCIYGPKNPSVHLISHQSSVTIGNEGMSGTQIQTHAHTQTQRQFLIVTLDACVCLYIGLCVPLSACLFYRHICPGAIFRLALSIGYNFDYKALFSN